MKIQLTQFKFFTIAFLLFNLLVNVNSFAQNRVSARSGNWSDANTWDAVDVNKTGTVSIANLSKNVTGTGTAFLTELSIGSLLYTQTGTFIGTVTTISSDTSLTIYNDFLFDSLVSSAYKTTGGVPSPDENVTIISNHEVYVDANYACASISIAPTNNNISNLYLYDTFSLTVNGIVTLGNAGANNRRGKIDMTDGGVLICKGFALGNAGTNVFLPGTGTVQFTADNTLPLTRIKKFNNLTILNGSTTAATNFTVEGVLNIASSSTLNMSTFRLLGASLTSFGSGLIRTQNTTSTTPLPNSLTWAGTVQYDGADQGVSRGTYNNLVFGGTGTKTLNGAITLNGDLSISSGVVANLKNLSSSANTLTLDGNETGSGTWGSTTSTASNKNDTYFAATTGKITITTDTCISLPTITTDVAANTVCFSSSAQTTTLAYSATTGSPVTYNISWDATPANSFAPVVNAVLPASPIIISVPRNTTGGTYTGTITVKSLYGCQSTSTTFTLTVGAIAWSSTATNTNWLDPSNWICGVPTNTSNVVINAGTFQPVISSNVTIRSLNILSGASVTVSSTYDLRVVNVIANEGTLNIENNSNLLQTNNVANTGTGITNVTRNSSSLFRLDYTLWSSPVSGSQSLQSFSPLTTSNRFYEYLPSTDKYSAVLAAGTFDLAKGYLIRMPNNWSSTVASSWTGTFSGTPNNGTFTHTLSTDLSGYNAVGNPYPSALNVRNFINGNLSNIEGTLWFWRKTNDDANPVSYSTITLAGTTLTKSLNNGAVYPNAGLISVGQGFLVKAISNTLNYNNSMRSTANINQFFKVAPINRYWIELKDDAAVNYGQNLIAYMAGATEGYDNGYDGLFFNDVKTSLFTLSGDKEVVIQARPEFDSQDILPLVFKTEVAGTYTIDLTETEGIFNEGQDIYLKDKLTGLTQNLKNDSYTFATDAGKFLNRFEITYQNSLAVSSSNFNENNVVVYKKDQVLIINSGNMIIDNVKVYDMQGRLLIDKTKVNDFEIKISANTMNQVLLVKITSENNEVVTKKVMN